MIQKRKVLSLVVCLMLVGLMASLISGCAPSGNGGDGDSDGEVTPQYGGVLGTAATEDPVGFDDAITVHYTTIGPYQCLWGGDWTKGNAGGYGTGEVNWYIRGAANRLEYKTGKIAESWTIGDNYIEFYLRDGVKWHDKFPCNGRELTADDVVFSLERQMTLDTAYLKQTYPHLAASMEISAPDEDTVRIDCPSQYMPELISMIEYMYIYPRDVIETYGDMNDWERAIGTGAFSFEEYVPGSSLYYEKNDLYWETNPVGPGQGDQLPYLDGIRALIQPDVSTIDSLFSTGEIALVTADFDRAQTLKTLSGVQYVEFFDEWFKGIVYMRTDKEDKPYHDVRVRQALMLAIDNQKIVDELYGGEGEILYWPIYYNKQYAGAYVPLEDLEDDMIEVLPDTSISVADLFGYNPELAQELLAEAGYPDGFKAEIVVYNFYTYMDVMLAVKDMWEEVGVDLTINAVDYSGWLARQFLKNYDDMLFGQYSGVGTYFKGINWSGPGMYNASFIDDPALNDYRDQMLAAYPDEDAVDEIHAEMLPYLLEQCYVLNVAGADSYRFWWPWLRNYSGEGIVGYYGGTGTWTQYVWIDQDLKEEMGH
jgi:peptide/nickel transport system substrate-binding protein